MFRPVSERASRLYETPAPEWDHSHVSAELDAAIHEKRLQLKDAFTVYQKAREAVARAYSELHRRERSRQPVQRYKRRSR